jgi:large subunit ribosomal protein L4
MVGVCQNLDLGKALFVMEGANENVVLSARNIPGVKTAGVNTINVYDILYHDSLVITKDAIAKMQEVYS